jgi:hypothetical protein
MQDVSRLLDAIDRGQRQAAGELLPLVYDELRRLAAIKLAQEKACQTLQPTALEEVGAARDVLNMLLNTPWLSKARPWLRRAGWKRTLEPIEDVA